MIPATLNLELYDGDSYRGPVVSLPSLAPFGGPSDLSGASVDAEIRAKADSEVAFPFSVEILDPVARTLRLSLTSAQVSALPRGGVWDLQVSQGAFVGTVLAGKVKKLAQVTR